MLQSTMSSPAEAISFALAWLRDLTIFGFVLLAGWKSRDLWQDVKDFTTAIRKHMTKMDGFAFRMEHNHAKHIQEYLYLIAKDRNIIAVKDPNFIEIVTEQPEPPSLDDDDASC